MSSCRFVFYCPNPPPLLTDLNGHRQQSKRRTPRLRHRPHFHGPANKRSVNVLIRTHKEHRRRPRLTGQGPAHNLADRLRVPSLIDSDLVFKVQTVVRGAGENARDASDELILERAVGVDVEGRKGRHLVRFGAEVEDQEAVAAAVGADGDVVAVEVGAGVRGDEEEEFGGCRGGRCCCGGGRRVG